MTSFEADHRDSGGNDDRSPFHHAVRERARSTGRLVEVDPPSEVPTLDKLELRVRGTGSAVSEALKDDRRERGEVYFTDRGLEELEERRGDEEVRMTWVADRMRAFVDLNPEFENAVDRLATFLARDEGDADNEDGDEDGADQAP
ncbi:DNA-binding PadR family transcriptional regulator [Saccharopolyspora lacisalsi]|uniref:DNA-binding PadR family transcriptional regulator n=1 Tax=Halosaccharopolyspora lacisalsi TaxID=1000566 RepID=A0A839DW26_9PSEU|nr:DNA-binding PadR family transcriptional regulator [Halosaccharopolyspora lacisalsi]